MVDVSKLDHRAAYETEEEFLAAYKAKEYPKPSVTVDLCVFTVMDGILRVLLIVRKGHPFRGCWALPGGYLDLPRAETLEDAARRELREETGLEGLHIEQLYTLGGPNRDPRGYVVTCAWLALMPPHAAAEVVAGDDAARAAWYDVSALPPAEYTAFDHRDILGVALQRLRGKIDYTPIAFELLPATFTVADLRSVHEAIKGTTYDPNNFRRRFKRMLEDGVIEEAPGRRATTRRPAKVYRFRRGA